jgi:two-component system, chemotaxis family, response regulator WspF
MRIAVANHRAPERICRILQEVPGYTIAWVAEEGDEAVQRCRADRPDLLLIDPDIPGLDGVEATRQIMERTPCPILIVTQAIEQNAARVFKAIGCGALDAVDIPLYGNDSSATQSRKTFLKKIKTMSRLQRHENELLPIDPPRPKTEHLRPSAEEVRRKTEHFRRKTETFRACGITLPPLIVIGSSTGGPKTLVKIFSQLPKDLKAAVVVVQHLDQEFSAGLAEWLSSQTSLQVRVAMRGGLPEKGVVDVAATNDHLVVTSGLTFAYTPEPFENPYRPSVNVFFRSVARYWPDIGCGIVLTGMGRDGAAELLTLRSLGWHTIAQDQATSIVYGMPKAAKELHAAVEVLPLERIAPAILKFVSQTERKTSQWPT